ncbi:nitroreductase family protein [Desulfatibacillum aliphaticivorans]|uniref:Nitroreductase n=1 Tax=Desulfatibacillum aliphaticivorans TaxID=218208 RepID=B8FCE3_DESAL|nr:nitroreductase family protein [Desulfatibacillum aliphaticivorans]ACL05561.1 nitroreductase [Desulfatibacillum aliphaticivorans]
MLLEKYRHMSLPQARYAEFVLDRDKCNGCGRCVKACPIQLLELYGKKSRPNQRYDHFRCITCQNCAASCPQNAITIKGDYRVDKGFWKNAHLFRGPKTMPNPLGRNGQSTYADQEPELTETEKVIYQRRSVRLYKKKKVPRDMIERVIEAGRFAPSAGNNQPWKFIAIDNRDVISALNEKCKASLYKVSALTLPKPWINKKTPGDKEAKLALWQEAVLPLLTKIKTGDTEPRARGGINAASSDPNYDIYFGAPAVILLLADKRGIGSVELDTGIAGQNMVLAAHSLGLGTCWVSLSKAIGFDKALKKKLGIEEPFKIISSLSIGYPQGQVDNPVAREQPRIHWVDSL